MSNNFSAPAQDNRGRPTKVLLVSQAPGVGGGERVVLDPISRGDLDVTVAAWPEVADFARKLGLGAIELQLPFVQSLSQVPALIRGARRVAGIANRLGAEVLYANGSRAITYCLAASRFGTPPILLHHHGFLGKGPMGLLRAGARRWANCVVAPSQAVARDLVPGRTKVIPYGIDLARFSPSSDRGQARRSFGLRPDSFVVGYVMRAAPGKGIEDFLSMASILTGRSPDIEFLLAGGPLFDQDRSYFDALAQRASDIPQLRLTGMLEEAVAAYAAIDVFVHLAQPEGFPTTAIEALASGVPVIGYDWGGLSELVSGGAGTLVSPGDVRAAADAAQALASDPEAHREACAEARRLAENRYSVERFYRELEAVVNETARGGLR